MGKIFTVLLLLNASFIAYSQVTKVPSYAIKNQYYIDNIRDTLNRKAGGNIRADKPIVKDSIIFYYNNSNQLIQEQIWKTGDPRYLYDTSRFFTIYKYDSLERLVSKRYGEINGSPHQDNPLYGNPTTHYSSQIVRIDSFAFDSRGNQLFFRKYELFDFFNNSPSNVNMVVNHGWEKNYEYDELGRITRERSYKWVQNNKIIKNYQGIYDLDFNYRYIGNTPTIRARTYYRYNTSIPFYLKDSLFTYDTQNRITGCKQYGYPISAGNTDYSVKSGFRDSIYYTNSGLEFLYGDECFGTTLDHTGRLKYTYYGSKGPFKQYSSFKGFELYGEDTGPLLINRQYDGSNNLLAIDSAYQYNVYNKLQSVETGFRFDTTTYYDFRDIIVTTTIDKIHKEEYFHIYPNPASEKLNIISQTAHCSLNIYTIEGINVYRTELIDFFTELDISHLANGIYVLEVNNYRQKLLVR